MRRGRSRPGCPDPDRRRRTAALAAPGRRSPRRGRPPPHRGRRRAASAARPRAQRRLRPHRPPCRGPAAPRARTATVEPAVCAMPPTGTGARGRSPGPPSCTTPARLDGISRVRRPAWRPSNMSARALQTTARRLRPPNGFQLARWCARYHQAPLGRPARTCENRVIIAAAWRQSTHTPTRCRLPDESTAALRTAAAQTALPRVDPPGFFKRRDASTNPAFGPAPGGTESNGASGCCRREKQMEFRLLQAFPGWQTARPHGARNRRRSTGR